MIAWWRINTSLLFFVPPHLKGFMGGFKPRIILGVCRSKCNRLSSKCGSQSDLPFSLMRISYPFLGRSHSGNLTTINVALAVDGVSLIVSDNVYLAARKGNCRWKQINDDGLWSSEMSLLVNTLLIINILLTGSTDDKTNNIT